MRHLIFAGTVQEAETHAKESGLDHGQWIYADRRHKIEGLEPSQMVTHKVGTWRLNDEVVQAWRYYRERCAMYGVDVPTDARS